MNSGWAVLPAAGGVVAGHGLVWAGLGRAGVLAGQ